VKIDLEQIRSLLSVVSQTDITELTIESGDEKITVKKANSVTVAGHVLPAQLEVAAAQPLGVPVATRAAAPLSEAPKASGSNNGAVEEPEKNGLLSITSPMVGTFYRAPAPTAPSFVDIGDRVNVGQTVCIIEAMKLMNDLPSEVAGKIVKILVENGTTVEFGQPLFLVDPKG
jgi:acetyl-CoA carboxylase biotin carboxyl carrier protein